MGKECRRCCYQVSRYAGFVITGERGEHDGKGRDTDFSATTCTRIGTKSAELTIMTRA